MAGQVWQTNSLGGYMWSPNLSRKLRTALQPMVRFRQFCDAREAFGEIFEHAFVLFSSGLDPMWDPPA